MMQLDHFSHHMTYCDPSLQTVQSKLIASIDLQYGNSPPHHHSVSCLPSDISTNRMERWNTRGANESSNSTETKSLSEAFFKKFFFFFAAIRRNAELQNIWKVNLHWCLTSAHVADLLWHSSLPLWGESVFFPPPPPLGLGSGQDRRRLGWTEAEVMPQ